MDYSSWFQTEFQLLMRIKNQIKTMKKIFKISIIMSVFIIASCKDLTELNVNPNGVAPETVNPNMLMSTVLVATAQSYNDMNSGTMSGVMQHTQQDAWSAGYNDYDWTDQNWGGWYNILRNNDAMYVRAQELGWDFHQGVALTMKSFIFGNIADLWGDAPYSQALKGDEGGKENLVPAYDTQQQIYMGVLADLEEAAVLFSSDNYAGISHEYDIYYGKSATVEEEVAKWRRFANSLMLRYYMRISSKMPAEAKAGVEAVANEVLSSNEDNAQIDFIGTSSADSWPKNIPFASSSNFQRNKMCAVLVDRCRELNDPRITMWAEPTEIQNVISNANPEGVIVIGNKRYIREDYMQAQNLKLYNPDTYLEDREAGFQLIDTSSTFVGIPPSYTNEPYGYNYNPDGAQSTSNNKYVSYMKRDIFSMPKGSLLKCRLMSYSEVEFALAEASLKGWSVGSAQTHYENGVQASFEAWQVEGGYDDYIAQPAVAFNNTLEQVMEQKWLASFMATTETWMDYRRTGLPNLQAGPRAKKPRLPLRFVYSSEELQLNADNISVALENLEQTTFATEGNNSIYSQPWLLQGTGKPW
jgi:hypothetical protein